MKTKVLDFLSKRKKAIAGLLAPIVVVLAAKKGMDISNDVAVALVTAIITGFTVHAVPNKGV